MADHGLGHGEKPDFIEVKGTISFLKSDPEPWYRSCTNGDCKRKVRPSPMPFTQSKRPATPSNVDCLSVTLSNVLIFD